jgi:hypothetical protein
MAQMRSAAMSAIAPLLGYKRMSRGRPNETNNRLGKFYDFQKA